MTAAIGNAAHWRQPGHGVGQQVQTSLTVDKYHELQRAATTAVNEGAPSREPSFTAPSEESSVGASPRRFSHVRDLRATADVASATQSRLEDHIAAISKLVAQVIHDGIRAGGIAEGIDRSRTILDLVQLSNRAIALTAERLESELV